MGSWQIVHGYWQIVHGSWFAIAKESFTIDNELLASNPLIAKLPGEIEQLRPAFLGLFERAAQVLGNF